MRRFAIMLIIQEEFLQISILNGNFPHKMATNLKKKLDRITYTFYLSRMHKMKSTV